MTDLFSHLVAQSLGMAGGIRPLIAPRFAAQALTLPAQIPEWEEQTRTAPVESSSARLEDAIPAPAQTRPAMLPRELVSAHARKAVLPKLLWREVPESTATSRLPESTATSRLPDQSASIAEHLPASMPPSRQPNHSDQLPGPETPPSRQPNHSDQLPGPEMPLSRLPNHSDQLQNVEMPPLAHAIFPASPLPQSDEPAVPPQPLPEQTEPARIEASLLMGQTPPISAHAPAFAPASRQPAQPENARPPRSHFTPTASLPPQSKVQMTRPQTPSPQDKVPGGTQPQTPSPQGKAPGGTQPQLPLSRVISAQGETSLLPEQPVALAAYPPAFTPAPAPDSRQPGEPGMSADNRETPSHPRSISMASPLSPEIKPAEHAQPPQYVYDTPEAEVPRIDMPHSSPHTSHREVAAAHAKESSPHTSQREVAAEHAKHNSPHTAQREVAAEHAKHEPGLTSVRPAHAAFAQQASSRQAGLEGSQPEAEPKASDANLPEGRGLPGIVAPLPSGPASLPALKAQIQIPYAGTRTVSAGLSATEVASAERPASTAPFAQPARPEAEEDRTRQAVSPFHAEEQRHRLEKALPGTQRLAGEPVPEIQIHIGRIEVRATPAAARSVAKQAAPARPALSLTAYLERRRGNEQ